MVVVNHPDLQPIEILKKKIVVECQGAGDVSLGCEDNQANPVVRPFLYELPQDGACHVEPVNPFAMYLEILRDHAAGHVQRYDNVHSAGFNPGFAPGKAGLGECENEQGQRQPAQSRQEAARTRPGNIQNRPHQLDGRVNEGRLVTTLALQPGQQGQYQQQQEEIWMAKGHLVSEAVTGGMC